MFPDPSIKPSFKRSKVNVQSVRARAEQSPDWKAIHAFVDFLESLKPNSFEVYYETERGPSGSREGYRVVHFPGEIQEKGHDTFQTWFCISASMS
jgi:hypothetical protein